MDKKVMISLVNLSMDVDDIPQLDKNVDDILSKLVWTKTQMISLVNLQIDKNVDDILSKSQYGQKRRGYPQ